MLLPCVSVPALTLVRHPHLEGQVVPAGLDLLWVPPRGGQELPASLVVLVVPEDPWILALLWIQEFLGSQLILGNPHHLLNLDNKKQFEIMRKAGKKRNCSALNRKEEPLEGTGRRTGAGVLFLSIKEHTRLLPRLTWRRVSLGYESNYHSLYFLKEVFMAKAFEYIFR